VIRFAAAERGLHDRRHREERSDAAIPWRTRF
jgi:hypothetical protein